MAEDIAMHPGVVHAQQNAEASPDTPSEEGPAELEPVRLFAGQHTLRCLRALISAYHVKMQQLTSPVASSSHMANLPLT